MSFILDIDERISAQDLLYLRNIAENDKDSSMYCIKRYDYLGKRQWGVTSLIRFFRYHSSLKYNDSKIHATITQSFSELGYTKKYCNVMIQHLDFLYLNKNNYLVKKSRYINLIKEEILKNSHYGFFNSWLSLFLGLEYFAINKTQLARENIQFALSQDSKLYLAIFCLAELDMNNGNFSKLDEYAEQLLSSNDIYYIDKGYFLMASKAHYLDNDKDAIQIIETAIRENPNLSHNYLNYSTIIKKYDAVKSDEYLRIATEINPNLKNTQIIEKFDYKTSFSLQNVVITD